MPPVTARDSGKGAFYAPSAMATKNRENCERPKHMKGKPKSCMSCQMPPVTVRDSGKGALYAPRCGLEREGLNLYVLQMPPVTARDSVKGAFYPLGHGYKLETPERARFTPLGHGYKVKQHFCDNFKGIRENSEIPKLHEKGKPKSCMSCQMPPVTVRDSGKGACTPLGVDLKVYNQL
ncbi:hypothetical protein Fcan01_28622 [Folsomia candida]|uniref:Uncharacterized protein n=1 Tax=Folsomia candida TaxID=158441 RepID=A0A226CW62_FOLCA|nr:hypothetical protein Fcan01_28622 [Folsomia candida]